MSRQEQDNYDTLHYLICHSSPMSVKDTLDNLTEEERRAVLAKVRNSDNEECLALLHLAVFLARNEVVRMLIENYETPVDQMSAEQAAVGGNSRGGGSTLWWASVTGNLEVAEYLVKKGADIDRAMDPGETPLHASIKMLHGEVAELLLRHGANPDIRDRDGYTAFLSAVKRRLHMPIQYIIANVPINFDQTVDVTGESALHLAACVEDFRTVTDLIVRNANPSLVTNAGLTPLECAAYHGSRQVYEFLIENAHGLSPTEKVNGMELFAASVALAKTREKEDRFFMARQLLTQALELRQENALDKYQVQPKAHYNGAQECVTVAELQHLGDSDRLVIEGLLILERILGANNALTHRQILNAIKYPGLASESLRFKLYVRYAELAKETLSVHLADAGELLGSLTRKNMLPPCQILQSFMESICVCSKDVMNMEINTRQLEAENLLKAMLCAVIAVTRIKCTEQDWNILKKKTTDFCALSVKNAKGYTLMHLAVDSDLICALGVFSPAVAPYFDITAVDYIAQLGCNLNTPDNHGNTPLYIAVQHPGSAADACQLVEILCKEGAMVDSGTRSDATAYDLCKTEQLKQFLREKVGRIPNLSGMAARAFKDTNPEMNVKTKRLLDVNKRYL